MNILYKICDRCTHGIIIHPVVKYYLNNEEVCIYCGNQLYADGVYYMQTQYDGITKYYFYNNYVS